MKLLGAEVVPVTTGSRTLKDAINEALRDWAATVADTHYVIGSVVGPHPFPAMVRDFQRVIGDEARAQFADAEGGDPDVVAACVGGGSNAIGMFTAFVPGTRPADRRRGRRRGGRPPLPLAVGGPPGRPARVAHVPAPGRARPGAADPFDLRGARLSGRGARALVAQGQRPRRVHLGDGRGGHRRVPGAGPARRASCRRSSRPTSIGWLLRRPAARPGRASRCACPAAATRTSRRSGRGCASTRPVTRRDGVAGRGARARARGRAEGVRSVRDRRAGGRRRGPAAGLRVGRARTRSRSASRSRTR